LELGRQAVFGADEDRTDSLDPVEVESERAEAIAEHQSAGVGVDDRRSSSGVPGSSEDGDGDVLAEVARHLIFGMFDPTAAESLRQRLRGVRDSHEVDERRSDGRREDSADDGQTRGELRVES
jgi:hypothetical protein